MINSEKASSKGVNGIKSSSFAGLNIFVWRDPEYSNSEESSFYKEVDNANFVSATTFKTDWVQTEDSGLFGWGSREFRKSMTFNIGEIWTENAGIKLTFLNN